MSFGESFSRTYLSSREQQMQQALALASQVMQRERLGLDQEDNQRQKQAAEWMHEDRAAGREQDKAIKEAAAQARKEEQDKARQDKAASLRQKKMDAVTRYSEGLMSKGGYSDDQVDTLVQRHAERLDKLFPEEREEPSQATLGQDAHVDAPPMGFPQQGQMGMPQQSMGQTFSPDLPQLTGQPRPPLTLGMIGGDQGPMQGFGGQDGQGWMSSPAPAIAARLANLQSQIVRRVEQTAGEEASRKLREADLKDKWKNNALHMDVLEKNASTNAARAQTYEAVAKSLTEHRKVLEGFAQKRLAISGGHLELARSKASRDARAAAAGLSPEIAKYRREQDALNGQLSVLLEKVQETRGQVAKARGQADKRPDDFNAQLVYGAKKKELEIIQARADETQRRANDAATQREAIENIYQNSVQEMMEAGLVNMPAATSKASDKPAARYTGGTGKGLPTYSDTPGMGRRAPSRELDRSTAAAILKEAGGDPNRARQIAKQRGYQF